MRVRKEQQNNDLGRRGEHERDSRFEGPGPSCLQEGEGVLKTEAHQRWEPRAEPHRQLRRSCVILYLDFHGNTVYRRTIALLPSVV
jgi:hypothetical protein